MSRSTCGRPGAFFELLERKIAFPGGCELDTLLKIFKAMGTPTPYRWTGMYHEYSMKIKKLPIEQGGCAWCVNITGVAQSLLKGLLNPMATVRLTAMSAIKHEYFADA